MFKRIDHVEIVPGDLERAIDFYTEILGFKIQQRLKIGTPSIEELVFIELNGTVIELFSVKNPAPASEEQWQIGCRRIALEVEDIDRALEFLKARGVEISREPTTSGPTRRAEIKDPDGLSIELCQSR